MTREDVIRQIVVRENRQQPLAADVVLQEAAHLRAAAQRHFGTWETALRYAGVRHRKSPSNALSEERILHELRTLCKDGYDLSGQCNSQRHRKLYNAARRKFGGWRNALRAAGVNLERIRGFSPHGRPSNQSIFDAILQRKVSGRSLEWKQTCLEDRALALAAKNRFGSWKRALTAAGLIPRDNVTIDGTAWDNAQVIEAIRRRHVEGKRLTQVATQLEEPALVQAARRLFGNWSEALLEARIMGK